MLIERMKHVWELLSNIRQGVDLKENITRLDFEANFSPDLKVQAYARQQMDQMNPQCREIDVGT